MLAQTPPMGWNTWNTFGSEISESLVREVVDKFVELGLNKAGYEYIVIDDCWSELERDPVTHKLVASKEKFPSGMKALSDYVHSKGLKFGMYSCDGVRTCANYPGSFDHEYLDAATFAEFGCDFLKYDNCFKPASASGPLLYRRMGHALRNCGREILFSACNWGSDDVWSWIRSAGAHMYRSTGDIIDNFVSFRDIALSQLDRLGTSAPGCFNDMDMLTVGMFGKGHVGSSGCNEIDYKTQFSLWCLMGSPLMLGCDIRKIDSGTLALVTNPELIAINQDPEARSAFRVGSAVWNPTGIVIGKLLTGGDIALGFFNLGEERVNIFNVMFESLGVPFGSGYDLKFTDLFGGSEPSVHREMFSCSVDAHDCAVYRVSFVKR